LQVDWENTGLKSKIVNAEILRGRDVLLKDEVLDDWLLNTVSSSRAGKAGSSLSLI
jgi:hypothetical protein